MSCKCIKAFSIFERRNLKYYLTYWITLLTLTITIPALAQQVINIPAKPLSEALKELGEKTNLQIIYDAKLVSGKTSTPVQGALKANESLYQLLNGTGITYTLSGNSATLIPTANSSQNGATTLPPIKVSGAAALGAATEGTGSYTTSQSSYGKGQSLKELPQTITVMTRQRIEDQVLTTLDGVLVQTPGITVEQFDTASSAFYARGFQITNFQIDGNSPLINGYNTNQLDIAMFDSIEVLRGSDALYGTSSEPSGAINLVRKKPTRDFQLKALAYGGSWNNYRGELDISGSIMAGGRIRGRLVGAYEDRKYFYDVANSDKALFYGIIEADITDNTLLTIGGNYMRQDGTYMRYSVPRYSNGDDLGMPRSTFLGTADDQWLRENNNQFIRIDQTIGNDWSLSVEASRNESDNTRKDFLWRGAINPITYSGLNSSWGGAKYHYNQIQETLDTVLKGSFHLLGGQHNIKLGANYSNSKDKGFTQRRNNFINVPNIFEFDPAVYRSNESYRSQAYTLLNTKQYGVYGSLGIEIIDPLKLIIGGRLSWYKFDQTFDLYNFNTGNVSASFPSYLKENKVFTPYVGLVYALSKQWSTYGSIAETYRSQATNRKGPPPGTSLDPVTGRSYEIGIKGSLFNDRLNTTLALYSIKRAGEAVEDPNYPYTPSDLGSSCCYLDDGKIISRGVDVEVSGEIIDGWHIQAAYTFNNNEDKAGNGRYSTITPKHLFKLWSSYALKGSLSGLKLGGGITAQSSTYLSGTARTFNATTGLYDGPSVDYAFTEQGRVLVDLFAQYYFNKRWSAAVNINNIFDKKYYKTVGTTEGGNWYGEPRNFLVSMRYTY